MSAALEHRRRVGPVALLAGPCESDCPACAEESRERRRLSVGVRDIVLGMWLEAVQSGERSVEVALRDVAGPLDRLDGFERAVVGWEFTRRALATKVRNRRVRKPRGLPAAWRKANNQLVRLVSKAEGLPIMPASNDYGRRTVFHRVAEVWREWGIDASARQSQDAYWPRRRTR